MNPVSKSKAILDTMFDKFQQPFLASSEKIEAVRSMWADEESKIAYDREIIFKILEPVVGIQNAQSVSKSGISQKEYEHICQKAMHDPDLPAIYYKNGDKYQTDSECLAGIFCLQEYQYKNIVSVHHNDTVLDCGAWCGDTALWFVRKGADEVWSFEIDRRNLECLAKNLQINNCTDCVHIVPMATWNKIGDVWYNCQNSNSGIGVVGEDIYGNTGYNVSVTTIDAFCTEQNIHPDFIKMDIEGAEPNALSGAQQYIREKHPDLAIALYHRINHMWDIPLLIKNICPDYKFYCKKIHFIYECILFATCRQ